MSIVKMKKIKLIGLSSEQDEILKDLSKLSCIEITDGASVLDDPEYTSILKKYESDSPSDYELKKCKFSDALKLLDYYAPGKSSLFLKPRPISFDGLYDSDTWSSAQIAADKILSLDKDISDRQAEISRLSALKESLLPWKDYPVSVKTRGSKFTRYMPGTLPLVVTPEKLEAAIEERTELAHVLYLSEDRDKRYVFIICHASAWDDTAEAVSRLDFTPMSFDGFDGTIAENLKNTEYELSYNEKNIETDKKLIASFASSREKLQLSIDRCSYELQQESAREKLLSTDTVFAFEGWMPASDEAEVTKHLTSFCCAWEFSDPNEGDDVPIKLKNTFWTRPLTMVTEMYSLPAYNGVDPNPLIMPFFTVFFGIMYADLGYGIVLTLLGILGLCAIKKKGTMRYMMGLMVLCGITTAIFGIIFGSFFGDFLSVAGIQGPVVDKLRELSLLSPMEDPMIILIGALGLGVIHILFGMFVKACMLIRDGHPLAALFDVGSWWLLFVGIAMGALGRGWYVAIAGVAALVLTQGRDKPTLIGKLVGGIASLYDITSYIGDILSYSRLMALLLASSVIASVVNILGVMTGPVFYIIIFIAGHGFNMAINAIGTYVHSARLQYLEFFGKFYKDGGRPFSPLSINTNYVTVIKEEK
jgi:V/A-type H+-transporting ATPase subunit I